MPYWINAKKEVPDSNVVVDCKIDTGEIAKGYYRKSKKKWVTNHYTIRKEETVSYWRPGRKK